VRKLPADSKGTTTASFLKIGVGARNIGLGETGAVSEDVNSVYWNPAGLASINEGEISLMYSVWLETINYEHLACGFPTKFGNLGGAVNYLFMSEMDKYDNTGDKQSEKMSATDMAITLTYSRNVLIRYRSTTKELEGIAGITAGVGFRFRDYCIDYAWTPYGQLGDTHRMSLSMKFGKEEEVKKEEVEKRRQEEEARRKSKKSACRNHIE